MPARSSARSSAGSGPTGSRATARPARDRPSFEGKPNWFDAVAEEHRAIRERVALIDQTSFAKFEISGRHALAALQRIAANDLVRAAREGGLYAALQRDRAASRPTSRSCTVADDLLYVVTGSGFGVRDAGWITRHLPQDGSVTLTRCHQVLGDDQYLRAAGARRAAVGVTDDDLSNAAFPYLKIARTIECRQCVAWRAVRVGYVGELGYELYVPQEYAAGMSMTRCGRRAGRMASPMPAIAPSTPAGWRRVTSTGRATSRPTTIPTRPVSASASRSTRATSSAARRLPRIKAEGVHAEAVLVHRRRLCALPWRRSDLSWRHGGRLDHQRRLRPHARQDDRLRLCAR